MDRMISGLQNSIVTIEDFNRREPGSAPGGGAVILIIAATLGVLMLIRASLQHASRP